MTVSRWDGTMTANSPGEKRRRAAKRERERDAYQAAMAALPDGASCVTCKHYSYATMLPGYHCSLDSDWEGYVRVKPDYVCPRYAAAAAKRSGTVTKETE